MSSTAVENGVFIEYYDNTVVVGDEIEESATLEIWLEDESVVVEVPSAEYFEFHDGRGPAGPAGADGVAGPTDHVQIYTVPGYGSADENGSAPGTVSLWANENFQGLGAGPPHVWVTDEDWNDYLLLSEEAANDQYVPKYLYHFGVVGSILVNVDFGNDITLPSVLNPGTDGQVLTVDSSSQWGLRYKTPASGGTGTVSPFEYLMPVAQTTATFEHTLGRDPTAVQVFVDGELCDEYTVTFPVPNSTVRIGFDISVQALIRIL